MSAFGGKADLVRKFAFAVVVGGKADMPLLLTQSGHRPGECIGPIAEDNVSNLT